MMSLASADPLADLAGTLALIRWEGGKKGNDWLNDKLSVEGFALAGVMLREKLNTCQRLEGWSQYNEQQ
ncbi:hypothetical protein M422DRAFT_247218 [Sphaerobolus stellatus SS14]|nr:hypothetical protein M422DRAFT_247218 [Sphaerobolus stellatus SS14]